MMRGFNPPVSTPTTGMAGLRVAFYGVLGQCRDRTVLQCLSPYQASTEVLRPGIGSSVTAFIFKCRAVSLRKTLTLGLSYLFCF